MQRFVGRKYEFALTENGLYEIIKLGIALWCDAHRGTSNHFSANGLICDDVL